MKKLPKIWFLRFKTKEIFDELCLPYEPTYSFHEKTGITNGKYAWKIRLGDYYYLPSGKSNGEEITYEQFKQLVLGLQPVIIDDLSYLIKLLKKLNIK